MTDDDLTAILDSCRRFNKTSEVTGMLLYKGGKFLQVLEGDETVVEALYQKIVRDSRHRAAEVLLVGQRPVRQFPDWSMGFANLSGFTEQDLPGFTSFLSDGFNVDELRRQPHQTNRLLLRFRDPMFQLRP
jgi:hypothetical protein